MIHNLKKEDRGMYYCVATNGVTEGTRRNVAVEVEFPPVISVPRPDVRQVGTHCTWLVSVEEGLYVFTAIDS